MNEDEKNEAMENIRLIKDLVMKTKTEMVKVSSGWIAIVWGIFCIIGFLGQQFLIPQNAWSAAWWTGLSGIAVFATFRISRSQMSGRSREWIRFVIWKFIGFWLPLVFLGYALVAFCLLHPEVSPDYISVAFMLVISTGYMILGTMVDRVMLYMGLVGFIGSLVTAIFFLSLSSLIFCVLFGIGLIVSGWVMIVKEKKAEGQ